MSVGALARIRSVRASLDAWLAGRRGRERALLGAAAALVVLVGAYNGAWRPLADARARAAADIARHDAVLLRARTLARSMGERPAPQSASAPSTILTATAPEFGVAIRRLAPEGRGVSLATEDAAFSDLMSWLAAIERDHGLFVTAIEMERRPAPGVAAARITVER